MCVDSTSSIDVYTYISKQKIRINKIKLILNLTVYFLAGNETSKQINAPNLRKLNPSLIYLIKQTNLSSHSRITIEMTLRINLFLF